LPTGQPFPLIARVAATLIIVALTSCLLLELAAPSAAQGPITGTPIATAAPVATPRPTATPNPNVGQPAPGPPGIGGGPFAHLGAQVRKALAGLHATVIRPEHSAGLPAVQALHAAAVRSRGHALIRNVRAGLSSLTRAVPPARRSAAARVTGRRARGHIRGADRLRGSRAGNQPAPRPAGLPLRPARVSARRCRSRPAARRRCRAP
jgi:hypothetical protein